MSNHPRFKITHTFSALGGGRLTKVADPEIIGGPPPSGWSEVRFRLYDDDGILYFEGVSYHPPEGADEVHAFAPLDWASASYGCTEIRTLQAPQGAVWVTQ